MDFKNQTKNFVWIFFSKIFRVFSQLFVLVYLTKFLDVREYGVYALLLLIVNIFYLFRDFGTGANLVQIKILKKKIINQTFTFHIFSSIFITIIFFLFCLFLNKVFYRNIDFLILSKYFLPIFIINSFIIVKTRLLERKNNYKLISIIDIVSNLLSLIGLVLLLNLNYGVSSLIFQIILQQIITILFLFKFEKTILRFDLSLLKKEIVNKYSKNMFIFNILEFLKENVDRILVSQFLGSYFFGLYNLANRISLPIGYNFTEVLARLQFTYYTRIQDDYKKISNNLEIYFRTNVIILLPIIIFLIFINDIFIETLFDEEWLFIKTFLPILYIVVFIQSFNTLIFSYYKSQKSNNSLKLYGLLEFFIILFTIIIGLNWKLIGVCLAILITKIFMLNFLLYQSSKILNLNLFKLMKLFLIILISSLIIAFLLKNVLFFFLFNFKFNLIIIIIFFGINFLISLIINLFFNKIVN